MSIGTYLESHGFVEKTGFVIFLYSPFRLFHRLIITFYLLKIGHGCIYEADSVYPGLQDNKCKWKKSSKLSLSLRDRNEIFR